MTKRTPLALGALCILLAFYTPGHQAHAATPAVPGTVATIAGGGLSTADGIPATDAAIRPWNVAVAPNGDIYFASDCRIRKVHGGTISTVAGTGTCGYTATPASALDSELGERLALAFDRTGDLFLADMANCTVDRVDASTGMLSIIAGGGSDTCYQIPLGDGGSAIAASVYWPSGIAIAPNGDVYIAEYGRCRVRRISDGVIETIAGDGSISPDLVVTGCPTTDTGDGGAAIDASLNWPQGLAIGPDGAIVVGTRCAIRRIADGIISTVAGTGTCAYGGASGPAATTSLDDIGWFALGASGAIFVGELPGDPDWCLVREIRDGVLTTVAGTPFPAITTDCPAAGDGGLARAAEFEPISLALDNAGNLIVADIGSGRLRVIYGADSDTDTDGDGYTDAAEIAIRADPNTYCGIMRADVRALGRVGIQDLSAIAQAYNLSIPPASGRLDQNADSRINILDLSRAAANYNRLVTACP